MSLLGSPSKFELRPPPALENSCVPLNDESTPPLLPSGLFPFRSTLRVFPFRLQQTKLACCHSLDRHWPWQEFNSRAPAEECSEYESSQNGRPIGREPFHHNT